MFSLLSQEEFKSRLTKLKPTATVVRDGTDHRDTGHEGSKQVPGHSGVAFPIMTLEEQNEFTISYNDACCNGSDNNKLLDILKEHGVAIVSGILDPTEQVQMEEAFLSDILSIFQSPLSSSSPSSSSSSLPLEPSTSTHDFKLDSTTMVLPKQMESALGFLPARGMPHGQFAWQCRLNLKVQTVFQTLFNAAPGDMITGLDNPFYTPRQAPSATKNSEWLHVDQNKNVMEGDATKQCFQGVLYVWGSDTSPDCSTTVVWPKSHRLYYETIMADPTVRTWKHHYTELQKFPTLDALRHQAVTESRRLAVPAGSLLLWDSRAVHQGWRSGARLAMPVCWEPRSRRDNRAMSRKVWMSTVALPSSHSASEGRVHDYMARRTQQTSTTSTGVGLRPTLIPWCVRPELEKDWQDAVERSSLLWQENKNAQENADAMDSSVQENILRLLKEEVVSVL
jgi:hypothetical protein